MKKILFLYVWFSVRGFVPRKKGLGISLSDYKARMTSQVSLMRSMNGKAGFVVLGDSNAENLDTVENRKQLGQGVEGFSLNFGTGEAYFTILQDAVHFSDDADRKFRIPIIRKAVGLG